WNVNSIRTRLPRLLVWLERRRPDIVCLQETKVADDQFPFAELRALGYEARVAGQQTYHGVSALTRVCSRGRAAGSPARRGGAPPSGGSARGGAGPRSGATARRAVSSPGGITAPVLFTAAGGSGSTTSC